MEIVEAIGAPLGAGLTLLILSYLVFGDNPLYKLALHIFVGALVGYSFGVVVREIVLTLLKLPNERLLLIPLAMGLWLLAFKGTPRLAYVGNFAVAYLVGVGAAVALGGALLGALVPQVAATARALSGDSLVDGLLIVVGTICTLMAFNFAVPKQGGITGAWGRGVGLLAWLGRIFLIFAFGVVFAGALTASLSILVGRVQYIIDFLVNLLGV